MHYFNKFIKEDFLSVDQCFYKGFLVKFIKWVPNWSEENLNMTAYWLKCKKFPPEIKHFKTLTRIGDSLGKLICIESD